jgi:hypothetical protein
MLRGPNKLNIPENATVLPWSVVFLVLLISVACVSSVMSAIDTWRENRTPKKETIQPQPVLYETDVTDAPLIPVVRKRRYDVSSDPQTRLPYLYSDSVETRYTESTSQPTLATDAPLIPDVHQRRYPVSSEPQTKLPYLYSDSVETRTTNEVPAVRQRRYPVSSDPQTTIPYLYSNSTQTR